MGDTGIDKFCLPIETVGGFGSCGGLEFEGMHPLSPFLSSSHFAG